MNITFRRAVVSDVKNLIQVQNRSFYDDFIAYGECPAYQETEEQMEKHIKECIVYVIEYENEVVGDLIVRKKSDERLYLRVICVVPELHNLGVGKKAIEYIEKDNPEVKYWELITPFRSYRNHYFYEKVGYRKVNEYKHSDVLTIFEYEKTI